MTLTVSTDLHIPASPARHRSTLRSVTASADPLGGEPNSRQGVPMARAAAHPAGVIEVVRRRARRVARRAAGGRNCEAEAEG